jgi:hypothetical protein
MRRATAVLGVVIGLAGSALANSAVPSSAVASSAVAASAQAAADAAGPAIDFAGWMIRQLGPVGASFTIGIVIPALVFVAKWMFDEVKAANAKQRDFVQKTSDKVIGLAWGHYWELANATGTLAGQLTRHLRLVDAHLLVYWTDAAAMQERMKALAADTEGASFVSFVRLLHAFERFQFRGSNTYLLPHHAAGEALRRLYNRFVESLGEQISDTLTDIRLAVERKLVPVPAPGKPAEPPDLGSAQFEAATWFTSGAERRTADWTDRELQARLDAARARYRTWLATEPAAVAEAADALHAFSRLMTHELATLHKVWHFDRGPLAVSDAWRQAEAAVASGRWPGVLDDRAVETVRRARSVSSFFSPLGAGTKPPPAIPATLAQQAHAAQAQAPQDNTPPQPGAAAER